MMWATLITVAMGRSWSQATLAAYCLSEAAHINEEKRKQLSGSIISFLFPGRGLIVDYVAIAPSFHSMWAAISLNGITVKQ